MTNTTLVLTVIIGLLVIAMIAVIYTQKGRTKRLKTKFGPEYDRLVSKGDVRNVEAELANRERRVEKLHIHELPPTDVARFSESWRLVQARFVDAPREALVEADRLVHEVMISRGYPMGNFDQRAADISVAHPKVVEHYRLAHDIAGSDQIAKASTEDLRQAMVHYRSLFEDLLSTKSAQRAEEVRR